MSKNNFEFFEALQMIAREKGIAVDVLLDALANALVAAYKRMPESAEEAVVTIDPDSGDIRVYGQELDEDDAVCFGSRSVCQSKHSLEVWDRFGIAQRMVEALPGTKLVQVPGVGHAPVLTEQVAVKALEEFLSGS